MGESDGAVELRLALGAWREDFAVEERLGGNRNHVWSVRLAGVRFAARRSRRGAASLDWEFALLDYLTGEGFRVPRPIPALDGRRHIDGLSVFSWLAGAPPRSASDWRRVARELARLHALTRAWPQRPGFLASSDLLSVDSGGDINLATMPADAATRCRAAWAALADEPRSVVHGDPGAPNIRLTDTEVGLLDWDEARVDASILDLVLPVDPGDSISHRRLDRAHAAAHAWEAACCWQIEPVYAGRRLAQLIARDADT